MSKVDDLGLRNTLTRLLEITDGCDPTLRLPQNLEAIFYGCAKDGPPRLASVYGDSCDNGEMGITIIRKKTGEATAYRFNLANLIALARLAAGLDDIEAMSVATIKVTPEQMEKFIAALDNPPAPTQKLRELMQGEKQPNESARVTELLEANNAYLERARKAEREVRRLQGLVSELERAIADRAEIASGLLSDQEITREFGAPGATNAG